MPCGDKVNGLLHTGFFCSKHMKKSENTSGNRRSHKPAPAHRLRRQEVPAAPVAPPRPAAEEEIDNPPQPPRRVLTFSFNEQAWALLAEMAQNDETTIENAARNAIARDVATFKLGGAMTGDEDEVTALFREGDSTQGQVVTVPLSAFGMAALQFYAVDSGYDTVEDAALGCVTTIVSTLTQIDEKEFAERMTAREEAAAQKEEARS